MNVYLSSTYLDLVDHRAAVARVLRQMGHEVVDEGQDGADDRGVTPEFLKAVLDWPHPYVPVTSRGELKMVVDRPALAEQLARLFVDDIGGARRRVPVAVAPHVEAA